MISGTATQLYLPLHVHRMLNSYPQTKIYFSHWEDTCVGSTPVKEHGKKVMKGVAQAVRSMDNLTKGMLALSEKHAFVIKVDPANFKVRYGFDVEWITSCHKWARNFKQLRRNNIHVIHSSWPSAFTWWSPWCSRKTTHLRCTCPSISSCAHWHWLFLRSTAKGPVGRMRSCTWSLTSWCKNKE